MNKQQKLHVKTAQLQSYNIPNYYIIQTADSVHGGAVTLERQIQPQVWEIVTSGLCNTKGTALKYSLPCRVPMFIYDTEMD